MWVFGYGSLLWNPGFEPVDQVTAVLADYHRSFCMLSIHHRGTQETPGLVLALDHAPGAQCTGVALKAAPHEAETVLAYLRERELVSAAYIERHVPLRLADGRAVEVTGNPGALARALRTIDRASTPEVGPLRQLYVHSEADSELSRLLSTHPPMDERIQRLQERAQQNNGAKVGQVPGNRR